jgi:hypothetical protein
LTLLEQVRTPFARLEGYVDTYVLCFCAAGDVLSQWRAYGERGGGFALGFRTGAMKHRRKDGPRFDLCKVEYRERVQRQRIEQLLGRAYQVLQSSAVSVSQLATVVRNFLAMYCVVFKSPAFREEREWRGVFTTYMAEVPTRFRPSVERIVPFVELPLASTKGAPVSALPLSVIRYGPTLQPDTTERSLRLILKTHGLDGIKVEASGVPLRAGGA